MKKTLVSLTIILLLVSVQQSYAQSRKEKRAKQKTEARTKKFSGERTAPADNSPMQNSENSITNTADTSALNTKAKISENKTTTNLLPGTLTEAEVKQRLAYFYNGNWKSLKERAKQEKKVFMVDFYTDWCFVCKQMDRELFAQDEAIQLFDRHFLAYKLNPEKTEKQLADDYNITAYPTFVFFDHNGNEIGRITGYLQKESFLQQVKKYIPKTPNTKYTKFR